MTTPIDVAELGGSPSGHRGVPVRHARREAARDRRPTGGWFWRTLLLWVLLTGAALVAPGPLSGQEISVPELRASATLEARCREGDPDVSGPGWSRVRQALAHPGESRWDHPLAALQDSLQASLAEGAGLDTRYLLAAVMGARSEVASGRSKLEWAAAMREQAEAILAEDPSHPGAHHLVGRLHAAVQRLGGVKRFLARHLFGSEVLDGTSWDSALRHLEHAKWAAPCRPEHHFELARLYADVGKPDRARQEVEHVLELIGEGDEPEGIRAKAEELARILPDTAAPERASDL